MPAKKTRKSGNDSRQSRQKTEEAHHCRLDDVIDLVQMLLPAKETRHRVQGHLAQSRVEFWKAIQTLIDARIESLEEQASRGGSRRGRVSRIDISE